MRRFLAAMGKGVYDALPDSLAAIVSEASYRMSSGPSVYRPDNAGSGRLSKGAVVFSIDFEMAWAWRFARVHPESCVEKGLYERTMVPKILSTLDEFAVPATWATVGHLFLDRCSRSGNGLAHGDLPRCGHFSTARWEFSRGDWYQHDPCTDLRRDPAWYARDLIESIAGSRTGHELGCHTFSHVGFGEYCPREVALGEMEQCRAAMRAFGLEPASFVFPGNDPGNFDVLSDSGIRSVRWFPKVGVELALPVRRGDGLWAFHSSLAIESRSGKANCAVRLSRLKSYLEQAIAEHLVLHVWFHPSFLPAHLDLVLTPFLRHCANLRENGKLDVFTMGSLTRQMESSSVHDRNRLP